MSLWRIISVYPPHPRLARPFLLPHEPRIQCRTSLGRFEVTIHSALDATSEDVDRLRRVLVEELATGLAFKNLNV